ncbi:MAG: tetratricopeptide repeat protein [Bacteroidales bacterium]|nr:tetratricopeptide repeat protein [Bacteroidales bacterium]
MRNRYIIYATTGLLLLFFSACSTQKNTWGSRHFHELTTRYNIYFNGHEAYKQGIKQLKNAHREDYTRLLPLYPVSNHINAKSTASNMDRSIEKCEKAIKKHSIRVKPGKKPNSGSSKEKKLFYSKEEFNPFMDEVFMLMANSQFHKSDFLSAIATCSYIIRHFSTDKVLCDKAGILMARAYTEMEWYYDAENMLNKLNKENLTPTLNADFSSAYADFLIRRKKYGEAIPYLEIAVRNTNRKMEKRRWSYLLAQLYQETGKKEQAYQLFCDIPGMNPPYEMELSANIRQTEVYPGTNQKKPLTTLIRLSRNSKNREYLDQLHYALGNLYFANRDTAKAIAYFQAALTTSKESSPQKLKTLLAMGDFYYRTEQYVKAVPNYSEALSILDKKDERFVLTSQRTEILKALTPHLITIHKEDSLQAVAGKPEDERNKLIDHLIKAAKEKAKEDEKEKSLKQTLNTNDEEMTTNVPSAKPALVPSVAEVPGSNSWYFYNPNTVNKGLTEFRRKWGKRSLEDDWRRNIKTAFSENNAETAIDSSAKDSAKIISTGGRFPQIGENKDHPFNPGFYLKNLPFTEDQIKASNNKIAEALYYSGLIYREQMENDRLAMKSFRELEHRFPKSPWLEKAYYITWLMLKQQKQEAEANTDRSKLMALFPESPLAKRLEDPLFMEKLMEMYQVQDSLYEKAFKLYLEHKTDSILYIVRHVEKNYPASPLIPRFTFLQAMESARTGQPEEYHRLLTSILMDYPKSNLIPTIKQMLALWNQGRRPIPSAGFTNLFSISSRIEKDSIARMDSLGQEFKFDPAESHVLLIRYQKDSTNIQKLQFDVALYNFRNFLIRDYELSFAKVGEMDVLLIRGFENAEDVMRYRSWINFQNIKPEEKYPGIRLIMVSESNLRLLEQGVSINKYLDFFEEKYSDIKPTPSD